MLMLLLAGCGGGSTGSSDLPPIPPTMTVQPVPTGEPIDLTPTPALEGQLLTPLKDGQKVTAEDRRYSLQMPQFWVRGTAAPDNIAFRESGGTPDVDGFSYRVTRDPLPPSVRTVAEFAEVQQEVLRGSFESVETLSVDPVQIGAIQGIRGVYTTGAGADAMLVHQVYLVDAGTGFVLTGSAPLDGDTDAARELFNQIAGSFSFPRG
jgi:hypothetical protein